MRFLCNGVHAPGNPLKIFTFQRLETNYLGVRPKNGPSHVCFVVPECCNYTLVMSKVGTALLLGLHAALSQQGTCRDKN